MSSDGSGHSHTRRQVLGTTAIAATALAAPVLTPALARSFSDELPWRPNEAYPPAPVKTGPLQFLTTEEAAAIDAMVDRLIPDDELGPGGKAAGCTTFIDRQDDLRAIAVYLEQRGAAAESAPAPLPLVAAQMQAGAAIYADTCMACHKADGSGVEGLFPRLAGAPVVQQVDATSLVRVVIQGSRSAATRPAPTAPAMPALGWRLSDQQVADVLTYIRNS